MARGNGGNSEETRLRSREGRGECNDARKAGMGEGSVVMQEWM